MTTKTHSGLFVCVAASALALLFVSSPAAADEGAMDADEIIERAVERNALGFESGRARVRLTVFDRDGEQRHRDLDVRSRRDGDQSRTLMTLTDPAEVRGQAFLFVENEDADDDMWMHVPALEVTRRVEGSQRRSSFLGTHFTFADLESRDLREASYRKRNDETIGDHEVYVVEARPDDPGESDYERVVAYVRKTDYVPIRIRFYDRDGELDKTLFSERLGTVGDDDTTYVERMTLRAETGGYTRIEIRDLDVDIELPASMFDREELGR